MAIFNKVTKGVKYFWMLLLNPFVHNSLHGGYFIIRLWMSITAKQVEIFKLSKDPVLCICINFKDVIHRYLVK